MTIGWPSHRATTCGWTNATRRRHRAVLVIVHRVREVGQIMYWSPVSVVPKAPVVYTLDVAPAMGVVVPEAV
jgi:hypothetical protein